MDRTGLQTGFALKGFSLDKVTFLFLKVPKNWVGPLGLSFLFILGIDSSLVSASSRNCGGAISESLVVENENARVRPEQYHRPNMRDSELHDRQLGPEFKTAIAGLRPGDLTLNSGAGFAIFSIELAARGIEAHAINAQDFWTYFEEAPLAIIRPLIPDLFTKLGISSRDLGLPYLVGDSVSGKFRYVNWNQVPVSGMEEIRRRVLKKVKALMVQGQFNYHVGLVEEVLPKLGVEFKIIFDLYGAFTYSADRFTLVEKMYEALAEGGRAFLGTGFRGSPKILDQVHYSRNRSVHLFDYLVTQYPEVFFFDPLNPQVLVVKKHKKISNLDLRSKLKMISKMDVPIDETSYPVVEWELVQGKKGFKTRLLGRESLH